MTNEICLLCRQRVKRKNYQFCSKRCTKIAAKRAPQLLKVPKDHVFYKDVKKIFKKNWRQRSHRLPTIARMYLITWTAKQRKGFDNYRNAIARKRKPKVKECKRFRSERRACKLGDPGGNMKLCKRQNCSLCFAIRTGFRSSLWNKQRMVLMGSPHGTRFGGGIYLANSSSKAYGYAKNINKGSKYRVMTVARVVPGRVQKLHHSEPRRMAPDMGYDSVEGWVGSPELVVFNPNAIKAAYLLVLKK